MGLVAGRRASARRRSRWEVKEGPLRSTIVPADEALLCVLEAGSEELVREVYARAGVPFERLSVAIADESEWLDAGSPPGAGGAEEITQRQMEKEKP